MYGWQLIVTNNGVCNVVSPVSTSVCGGFSPGSVDDVNSGGVDPIIVDVNEWECECVWC